MVVYGGSEGRSGVKVSAVEIRRVPFPRLKAGMVVAAPVVYRARAERKRGAARQ